MLLYADRLNFIIHISVKQHFAKLTRPPHNIIIELTKSTHLILKNVTEGIMAIELVAAYDFPKEVRVLFTEYTTMLTNSDPTFKKYLDIQNYNDELDNLSNKYGLPDGRLYLAYYNGVLAGCIGLKKIDEAKCEMKRLYVRPAYRKQHIATVLVRQIISDAKSIGYKFMFLDTLPFLQGAINMYKKIGFKEISSYNNSPMETSIFMRLDLSEEL